MGSRCEGRARTAGGNRWCQLMGPLDTPKTLRVFPLHLLPQLWARNSSHHRHIHLAWGALGLVDLNQV